VAEVLARSARDVTVQHGERPGLRFVLELLRGERRLIRRSVLLSSAVVMTIGVLLMVVDAAGPGAWGAGLLAVVAPVAAAGAVAGVAGPSRDPARELLLATPTSPRLVLLARLALVFTYNFALAVLASIVATVLPVGQEGLVFLVFSWLGPMALLSALGLLLAAWVGHEIAMAVVYTCWGLRVLVATSVVTTGWLEAAVRAIWSTNVGTLLAAAVLTGAAVIVAGRGEPGRTLGATQ
jgi:hypothetical protein